jgi:hypothetical protein
MVDKIIRYENGTMDSETEIIEFFQELINTGMAWSLQGHYGRTAMRLIEEGLCEDTNV